MPFRERSPVEERIALFREFDSQVFSVIELCARWGISRDTFYVWKRRRDSGDAAWFAAKSHAPSRRPHKTDGGLAERIIAVRRQFPHFGPKKVMGWLEAQSIVKQDGLVWPAASTIGDILKAAGLVAPQRRRRRALAQAEIVVPAKAPNDEWAIDFKGWYRTATGLRCDPLTVTDQASRYLLEARIVSPTTEGVKVALWRLFEEVGLPAAMRTDNGAPFGSSGAGGLSKLSVWWLKLGIDVRYIPPASPQDNGRHERMHRTLKAQTGRTPAASRNALQTRFDTFRKHFNEERPHEALQQTTPASHWRPPTRALPSVAPDPWYDADHQVRRVRHDGSLKWRGEHVFIGEALAGELVGLAEHETGGHIARFGKHDLGLIDRDRRFLRFAPPRARLRVAPETAAKARR